MKEVCSGYAKLLMLSWLIASSPNRSSDLRNMACSIAMNYRDISI